MDNVDKIQTKDKILIGRNEWCQLPNLNIPAIKAKIDTGAKTSAIHAVNIQPVSTDGTEYVMFSLNPLQGHQKIQLQCKEKVIDRRFVTSSNGHREHRYVISTVLGIANQFWEIELTLSNRDPLKYRLLLGREALNKRVLIDPSITCFHGRYTPTALDTIYHLSTKI